MICVPDSQTFSISRADHLEMAGQLKTKGGRRVVLGHLNAPILAMDLEPVSGRSDDHLPKIDNSDNAVYAPRRDAGHAVACDEPLVEVEAGAGVVGDRPPEGEGEVVEAGSRSGADKSQIRQRANHTRATPNHANRPNHTHAVPNRANRHHAKRPSDRRAIARRPVLLVQSSRVVWPHPLYPVASLSLIMTPSTDNGYR